MEYKQLLDTSNVVVAGLVKSVLDMGINVPLLHSQMANILNSDAKDLVAQTGVSIEGTDVKSISESFVSEMLKLGATQRAELVSASDSEVIMDLGECVFAPATIAVRGGIDGDPTIIPPCPFIGMLIAALNSGTDMNFSVSKCEWKPELNTSVFTINGD